MVLTGKLNYHKFNFSFLLNVAPGTYSPEKVNLEKGPQYSISGKPPSDKPNDNPGTHCSFKTYNLSFTQGLMVYIQVGKILNFINNRPNKLTRIGPGSYNPERFKNLEHVRHYNFGKRTPLHKSNDFPGKGDY